MHIQQRHGLFPRILGKGDNARKLANRLLRGRKELDVEDVSTMYSATPSNSIDNFIIADRDVDFGSMLLTQLTYEGFIDDLIGIKHNKVEVDSSVIASQLTSSTDNAPALSTRQSLKRIIQLDSTDSLYSTLRPVNFVRIGPLLTVQHDI